MVAQKPPESSECLLVQLGNTTFRYLQFFGYLDERDVVVVMHNDKMALSFR